MLKINNLEQYESSKLLEFNDCTKIISNLKSQGKTVGLCHGGFDLIHPGHIKHFESAKNQCDFLIVSITSDKYVSSRKGTGRPIYTDKLRAYAIANLETVDYVVITDFKLGVDVINNLKPTYYIKGPDFIHKMTPGIISERETIKNVGGEMKYTTEPPMSTTGIIRYIKDEVDNDSILIIIDRDGTIIKNNDFLGRNNNWKNEIKYNDNVINFISYLQTKYKTTKLVVTNQAGVARGYFSEEVVKNINFYINDYLNEKGIKIDDWQYCPYVDSKYAELKKEEINFDPNYVKEKTKRKPSMDMVNEGLKLINKKLNDFSKIMVIGDRLDDKDLANNLNAKFIDVNGKKYDELVKEI